MDTLLPRAALRGLGNAQGDNSSQSTYFPSAVAVQDPLHFLKSEDGVLDPEEQGALPVDRTCYRGVILVQGRVVQVLNKEFVNYVDLKGNRRCSKWNASAREPRQTELGVCVFKATNTGMSEIERDTEPCSWLLIIYYFFLHPRFFSLV